MGVQSQGIFGAFKNKVGNLVGSSWRGIAVVKTKPLSVANPRTAGQVTQRTAFSLASKWASILLQSTIPTFWNRFAVKMSGYNSWIKENVEFMLDGIIANYSLLVMSKGKLTPVATLAVVADNSDNSISISKTESALNQYSANTDLQSYVVYNETQDYYLQANTSNNRAIAGFAISDTRMETGDTLHVWHMYRRSDGTYVSDSKYATTVVVA